MKYLKEYLDYYDREQLKRKYPELTSDEIKNPLLVDIYDIFSTLCYENPKANTAFDAICDKYNDFKFEDVVRKILNGNIIAFDGACECYHDHSGKVTKLEFRKVRSFKGVSDLEVWVKTLDCPKHPIDKSSQIQIFNNQAKVKSILFKAVESKKNQKKFDL